MMSQMVSRENNTRRVPRISLDRLYIDHTRSNITTEIIIRVLFFSETELHDNSQSAAPRNKERDHPVTMVIMRPLK